MECWTIKIYVERDTVEMKKQREKMKILNAPEYQPDAQIVLDMVEDEGVGALMHRIQSVLPSTQTVTQQYGPAHVALFVGKLSGEHMSNLGALISDYISIPWEGTICARVEKYVPQPPRTPRMQKRDIPPGVIDYVENFTDEPPDWVWAQDWSKAHGDDKSTTITSDIKRKRGPKRPLCMKTRMLINVGKYEVGVFRGKNSTDPLMYFCVPKKFRVGKCPTNEEVLREIRYHCYLGN